MENPLQRAAEVIFVDADTLVKRRNICATCPEMKSNGVMNYCGVCKCPIASKTKVKATSCPQGKW